MFSTPVPLTVVNVIVGADYTESPENNLKAATINTDRWESQGCLLPQTALEQGTELKVANVADSQTEAVLSRAHVKLHHQFGFAGFHIFICSSRSHQPEVSSADASQLLVQLINASHAASLQPSQAQLQAHVCFCCWRDHLKGNSLISMSQRQHTSDTSLVLPNGPTFNRRTLRPNGGFATLKVVYLFNAHVEPAAEHDLEVAAGHLVIC